MGSVVSTVEDLEENELLKKLASTESIVDNDPYWNKLFSFNFNMEQMNRSVSGVEWRLRILSFQECPKGDI